MKLKEMYELRFNKEYKFRNKVWSILCNEFFQKYIPKNSIVLDVAAGHGEFINHIKAKRKIALDLNPDTKKLVNKNTEVIISKATNMKKIKSKSVDIVFTSNFFEHLTREEIIKVIQEINRVLKKNGKFLLLQPNYRYCYKNYWNFFDHITALDDKSMVEALTLNGFKIKKLIPKFLPFTTKSNVRILPEWIILLALKLTLKISLLQSITGGQMFIFAIKNK